ncbi:MAG TPA: S8 family serine peptidase, partial [Gemmatales bacterium]|nr:S8 family serine peptidase [Gemmatales bacterium]
MSRRAHCPRTLLVCEVLEDRCVPSASRGGAGGGGFDAPKPFDQRPFMPDEVVVRFHSLAPITDVTPYLAQWFRLSGGASGGRGGIGTGGSGGGGGGLGGTGYFNLRDFKVLLNTNELGTYIAVVHVHLLTGSDLNAAVAAAHTVNSVSWAQRNYIYGTDADPRELTPNDPQYPNQYHHPLMRNNFAWDTTQGEGIIIAVMDDGVQLNHPDLAANIWVNTGEIPGNGIDDDGNGFIDDVNGWDFSSNDNNPNPVGSDDHGTHVAGIAAARTGNGIGVAGTAGRAQIMPIRWYGSGAWTSTVVLNSYTYAVDNGAHIINVSYNIDGFVNDLVFHQAANYVHNNDVLLLNSAGNNGQLNPPRQIFDQMLFVVNTTASDLRSGSSNYGWGVDISAPGTSILSTVPGGGYASFSGTSMAAPNAAGVAALIWANNPTWTRDQVAAQLVGTADNIDLINPTAAGLLGSGRVNSFRAVTGLANPPRVVRVDGLGVNGGGRSLAPSGFTVQMWGVLDRASANNIGNWRLVGAGADGLFNTADDVNVALTLNTNYMYGTNRLSFTINGAMTNGRYRFVASEDLVDPFGQRLDGNNNFAPGGDFIHEFTIDNTIPGPPSYGPDLFGYGANAVPYSFQDIRTTGTVLIGNNQDDASNQIPVGNLNGFTFTMYGVNYNTLWASSNGLISFGASVNAWTNTDLTSSPTQAVIAPFWDDLHTGAIGDVRYHVFGTGDNQDLVIQWTDVRFFAGPNDQVVTFQAVLSKATGNIRFNYLDVTTTNPATSLGVSATVGIKAAGTQSGAVPSNRLLIHFNTSNPDIGDSKSLLIQIIPPPPPNIPPRIVGVSVGGTGWSYDIPSGSAQLQTIPWAGVNRISIRFDSMVWIGGNQMVLQGVNQPIYAFSSFAFDPVTYTATWSLPTPIVNDKLRIVLKGTGATPVRALQNAPLDGAWLDTFTAYPSGSGVGGTDFRFRLNVLVGDADGNGVVNSADTAMIVAALGMTPASPGWNLRFDINRNDVIDAGDVTLVQGFEGSSLPSGEPGGG